MAAAAGTHVPPSGQQRQKEKQKKADDSAHARMTDAARSKPSSSALFVPFRALGLISDGVAFALQRRGKETFLVTSVGTSWQIYNAASLRLRLVGPDVTRVLPSRHARPGTSSSDDDVRIAALACAGDLTFAAVGDCVVECRRVHRTGVYRVSSKSTSSASSVLTQLLVLGGFLIGLNSLGVYVWEVGSYGLPTRVLMHQSSPSSSSSSSFHPTCMAHPQTYLNKILVGSSDGRIRVLNINTGKVIYEFASLESSVETIVASPAVDVVAVGLLDGRVVLRDVRQDVTMLSLKNASGAGAKAQSFLSKSLDEMRYRSMESSCSAVAFDGYAGGKLLATGGTAGVISVWNLETQTVHAIIRDAHDGGVTHMEFLQGQPVLVSSGEDNSVKEWVFDGADGQPRLLRYRSGHAAPPTIVRHYADSTRLLSGGQDRAFRYFSTVQDAQSREMSQGHVVRRAKKLKVSEQELKLGRITALDACDVRERDWSNVITAHEQDAVAYVWRIQRFARGEFALAPPTGSARGSEKEALPVSSVCLSRCGNFGFVGSEGGRIDRYNMQSGLHRGAYTTPEGFSAHSGAVTGLAADACNKYLVSGGLDGVLKCWELKTRAMRGEMDLGSKIGRIAFHPTTCLVAVACDDGVIRLCDVEASTIVRRFKGHTDRITDLQFSADCRWLLSSGMDSTLRIWDVPGSTVLQVLQMESPITSLSLAPAMDVLVTTHVEKRGIYAWANELIFGALDSITASGKPIVARMPVSSSELKRIAASEGGGAGGRGKGRRAMLVHTGTDDPADDRNADDDDDDDNGDENNEEDDSDDEDGSSLSALRSTSSSDSDLTDASEVSGLLPPPTTSTRDQQVLSGKAPVAPAMITMSMLPRSQWLNMIHIDSIKTRNKPIEPPKKPEAAPFFLPTAASVNAGRDPVFMSEEDQARVRKAAAAAWGDDDDDVDVDDADVDVDDERNATRPHASRVRAINGKHLPASPSPDSLPSLLDGYTANKTWRPVLAYLKSITPSKLDVQLRSLDEFEFDVGTHPDDQADQANQADQADQSARPPSHHRLLTFMQFLCDAISSSTDFEFLQALLRAFILIHGAEIAKHKDLKDVAEIIAQKTASSWKRIRVKLHRTQCIVGILQNNH